MNCAGEEFKETGVEGTFAPSNEPIQFSVTSYPASVGSVCKGDSGAPAGLGVSPVSAR